MNGKKRTLRIWQLAAIVAAFWMLASQSTVFAQETKSTLPNGESVYNILLIGSDHRDTSWNGNSDVMIVLTINQETQKLILTSFMRDLYAEIPEYGTHKLNYAYAVGGAKVLINTLEDNYRLTIDNYAAVDFETMADIIDVIGGVEMEISDAEAEVLDNYLRSVGETEKQISGGGTYLLDGDQAVAYMRIRYVGNADYQRTQRQRDVLSEIFASFKGMDATELTNLANEILPYIEHDIDALSMIKFMALLPELTGYKLEEGRIPYDDLYHSSGEMLVPDFEGTISRLHETLYGAE